MPAAPQFTIDFPPRAHFVSTARIFCGAVARHYGCDPADIEDLKIALSEACSSAISHAGRTSDEPVRLVATPDGGMLTFEVNGHRRRELEGRSDGDDTEQHMMALSAELIAALFPDAEFVDTPEGTFFRISVMTGSSLA